MGTFGEGQMMAQLAATTWLVSPVMHQDVVLPRGMMPFPRMAGDGQGSRLVGVGGLIAGQFPPIGNPKNGRISRTTSAS
jgi:hypothetical protein